MKKPKSKKIVITSGIKDRLPLSQLTPLQGNLKELPTENYQKLRRSILRHGFIAPLFIWEDTKDNKIYIIDGHQRHITLGLMKKEGYSIPQLPVIFIPADSVANAKEKLGAIASQYGKFNEEGVKEFFESFEFDKNFFKTIEMPFASIPDLIVDEKPKDIVVEGYVRKAPEYIEGEDDFAEPIDVKCKIGQVFNLGKHRLMCGDSKELKNIEFLLNGESDYLLLTDPPYGMSVVKPDGNIGGSRIGSVVGKSKMHKAKVGIYKPIIGDEEFFDPSYLTKLGSDQIIFGANHFHTHLPLGPHWIVWYKDMPVGTDFSGAELAWTSIKKRAVKTYKWTWAGMTRQGNRNDELEKRVHPTQKPVGLFESILNDYQYENILDLFGGSGSTLIACEKTNRKCFMMELDPHYVSVIIERWQKFTGKKAQRINSDGSLIDYDDIKVTKTRKTEREINH